MATDYDDERRKLDDTSLEESLEALQARQVDKNNGVVDVEDTATVEGFVLPGADLSGEELTVQVLPRQADEFTCTQCFLVRHRSQALTRGGELVCNECAAA